MNLGENRSSLSFVLAWGDFFLFVISFFPSYKDCSLFTKGVPMTDKIRKPRRSFLEQMQFNLNKSLDLSVAARSRLEKAGFDVGALNEVGMLALVGNAIAAGTVVTASRASSIEVGDIVAVKEKFIPKYTVEGVECDLENLTVNKIVPGRGGYMIVTNGVFILKVAANHVKRV
jgi:hypothetical protein